MSEEKKQLTYADAGVDIDAGNRAVELMKDSVRASYRPEVIGDLGGFGGLFALDTKKRWTRKSTKNPSWCPVRTAWARN